MPLCTVCFPPYPTVWEKPAVSQPPSHSHFFVCKKTLEDFPAGYLSDFDITWAVEFRLHLSRSFEMWRWLHGRTRLRGNYEVANSENEITVRTHSVLCAVFADCSCLHFNSYNSNYNSFLQNDFPTLQLEGTSLIVLCSFSLSLLQHFMLPLTLFLSMAEIETIFVNIPVSHRQVRKFFTEGPFHWLFEKPLV